VAAPTTTLRRKSRELTARPWVSLLLAAWTILYLVWSLAPIAWVLVGSFNVGRGVNHFEGFSLRNYELILRDPELRHVVTHTFSLALAATGIASVLGVGLSLFVASVDSKASRSVLALAVGPIAIPQVTFAVALFLFFTQATPIRLGTWTQLAGHATLGMAVVTVTLRAGLSAVPADQELTAMDLGASPSDAFRRVVLPQVAPYVAVGSLFAFALSLDTFVLSSWLCIRAACQTVPVVIYQRGRASGFDSSLLALASIPAVIALCCFGVAGLIWLRLIRPLQSRPRAAGARGA
jgi:spermidine/putrescine transport system permease protein